MSWKTIPIKIVKMYMKKIDPPIVHYDNNTGELIGKTIGTTAYVFDDGTEYLDETFPIGSIFYMPECIKDIDDIDAFSIGCYRDLLSDYYFKYNSNRRPILVKLPNSELFCIDSKSSDGNGLVVTDDLDNITVSPSIDIKKKYHGFLTNGIISDDVEGKKI